jgi:hypothetical protein
VTRIVVEYRETPRGQWWQETWESKTFGDYEGYEHFPGHEIAVDYRYDYSSRGNLRIIEFEFDVVEDEYWDAAPTYRRQLVRERIVRRFTKEHSIRLVEGEDRLFSLVRE